MQRILLIFILFCGLAHAQPLAPPVQHTFTGTQLQGEVLPDRGGIVTHFELPQAPGNLAGSAGLINEGFGVPSLYVPNRRLNESLTQDSSAPHPTFIYTYDCDGPNISGLQVTRRMEALPNAASLRVEWSITNTGEERQWVAPWVRNSLAPGGSVDSQDTLTLPTLQGIHPVEGVRFYSAARNWFAATDPVKKSTVFAVFDADALHAFRAEWPKGGKVKGVQASFVPRVMEAGSSWSTTYRINAVRGLSHVDFASDELAAQLDYSVGKITLLLAPTEAMENLTLHASVMDADGAVWALPKKKFNFSPNRLVRATYDWTPPKQGTFEFLAQIRRDGEPVLLGQDTNSPHGGIDTQFVVGNTRSTRLDAWTDAPYALEQGERTFTRNLLRDGSVQVWQESAVNKIFRTDTVEARSTAADAIHVRLARNEWESTQLVLRPKPGQGLSNLHIQRSTLRHNDSGAVLPAEDIQLHAVRYHHVPIPSHYEGATGYYPDALVPYTPQAIAAGQATPIWITVYAQPDLPAGEYEGYLELSAQGLEPLELPFKVTVYGFSLPNQPSFKTDFVYDLDQGAPSRADVLRYRKLAREYRITLREFQGLPEPQTNYANVLETFLPKLKAHLDAGQSTLFVPASLLNHPEQLKLANAFVKRHGLEEAAFVQLGNEPRPPEWDNLIQRIAAWKVHAPNIPVMVTTTGLQPFLQADVERWVPHLQLFDTTFNRDLLDRIASGQEVWWYINHAPPRPYSNLFVDFPAMEHRMLFWQAWALGVKGMHYWAVNYIPPGTDPEDVLLDFTPVNGDGLLLHPTDSGPAPSIRWACIRDGIEDYEYLRIFRAHLAALEAQGTSPELVALAQSAYDLKRLVPNLLQYTRDPAALLNKRHELALLIERMAGSTRLQ